jgi:hypothetical protein
MGVRSPLPGTGAISATSTTSTAGPAIRTRAAFTAGAAVFRSAQIVPPASAGSDADSAGTASCALLTLRTTSASRTASASLRRSSTPRGGATSGS